MFLFRKFESVRHKSWHSLVPVGRAATTRPVDSDELFASSLFNSDVTSDSMMTSSVKQERTLDRDYEADKFFSGRSNYLDSNFMPTT